MGVLLFICAIVVFGIFMTVLRSGKSHDMIETWATENGCRVIATERRSMFRGPFSFTTGKGQTVYYVTFQTPSGRRKAFVRCGSWLGGLMFSDRVDVRWEE